MSTFTFKKFTIRQTNATLKIGTDAMVLGALIQAEGKYKGLDIGTGTGVLALMQAQKNDQLQLKAIEIHAESAEDAAYNFDHSQFADQLNLIQADFLAYDFATSFDLIFSNPPYYENGLKSVNPRLNQAKHVEGLTVPFLCQKVVYLLEELGHFWVIWPFQEAKDFQRIASEYGLCLNKQITLLGKPNSPTRQVMCFSKTPTLIISEQNIEIRNSLGEYSDEYKLLTKEFHFPELN